ncbi:MAG: DoxX family protein [Myxococcota bacterium]
MATLTSKLPIAARLLLGLIFFVFGLNGFLNFLPQPPVPEAAGSFLGALAASGYFFPVLKATEVAVGAALLSNRFVPLSLVVIAPVSIHILLFHAVLAPSNMVVAVGVIVLNAYLGYAYRESFRGVLKAKAEPTTASSALVRPATA